ncbi:putative polysaccharide biosynthesis protein [Vagococcus jeotgali]|uniref:putative polysaccharide biosynthesis protein n=1 Tax=Vagococcus jeotgali TaxID=3109030 RepID=UPI002DDA7249|nr:polysaccharide biosynthesis protein [Vagococcus sp. B2T-5]
MNKLQMEKKLLKGTMILTATSFIVKLLSAIYRVPFQNLVGDEGFYVYQQVYPIYGIAMTLALSGMPIYLSKLLASETLPGEKLDVLKQFFWYLSVFSISLFALLFFGAKQVAMLMGDVQLTPLIQVVSIVFLFVPFLSTTRGYFQGELNMIPTATSQLVEQGIRVTVILFGGYLFTTKSLTVYQVGSMATSGAIIGGFCASFVLLYYVRKQISFSQVLTRPKLTQPDLLKRMIIEGGTLCLFSAYLVVFQLIDSFTVKKYLVYQGMPDLAAKIAKGVFDRGQPLVQLGLVVAVSMTATFMPTLTHYFSNREKSAYYQTVTSYIRVSLTIALAAGVGLSLLMPFINTTLFSDNQGSLTLSLFVLSVTLVSMIQTYQTIYQSQNRVKYQLLAALFGLLLKMVLTPVLTFYFGTVGSSFSTLLSLVGCLIILHHFLNRGKEKLQVGRVFLLKLTGSILVMVFGILLYRVGVSYVLRTDTHRLLSLMITLLGVVIGFILYLLCLIKCKIFNEDEWNMLPFGHKIINKFYKKEG